MKERLDKILFDLGYFETKSKAQAAIMAGNVKINGEKITKAGYQLEYHEGLDIEVKSMPFVSRGGYKLAKAVKAFELNLNDRICLDAGASTGGFTDCMLQNGANFRQKYKPCPLFRHQIFYNIQRDNIFLYMQSRMLFRKFRQTRQLFAEIF